MNLLNIITSPDTGVRNRSIDTACLGLSLDELLRECQQLDEYRRGCDNLYDRVRSLFFLYAIHRFHLPKQLAGRESGRIPYGGYEHMLNRRYPEAIDIFLSRLLRAGRSVSSLGVSNTGGSSAPQRTHCPRQPMDVSDRTSGGCATANPP